MREKKDGKIYIFVSFVVAFSVFLAVYSAYGIRFETNDDATLSNIAAGSYGRDRARLIYVNVIFGALIRPLYSLFPSVNWYLWVQIALMIGALTGLFYVFFKNLTPLPARLLCRIVAAPFAVTLFYSFQYVKCRRVVMARGLVLVADDLGKGGRQTARGIALTLTGSLIRWENFFAVGAMSACMLLLEFFKLDKEGRKKAAASMAVLFCLVFGAKAADIAAYNTPEWKRYKEYNRARMELSDYKIYLLEKEGNPLESRQVSALEYEMLSGWDFWDEENFTAQRLREISGSISRRSIGRAMSDTVKTALSLTHGESYRYAFCLVVIMGLLLLTGKGWLAFFGSCAVLGGLIFYLNMRMRFPARVEVTLLFSAVAMGLFIIIKSRKRVEKIAPIFALVLCLSVALSLHSYGETVQASRVWHGREGLEEEYFAAMTADKEHLYLLSTEAIQVAAGLDAVHPRGEDFYSNIVAYGGWLTYSPSRKQALENYGVSNVFIDGVDNEKVYYGYHNIDRTARYASARTGKKVEAVRTGDNPFAPYQLVTAEEE